MHGLGRCVEVYDYISVYMYSCTATAWAREHLPYRGVRPGRWGRHSVVLVVVVVVVVMIMACGCTATKVGSGLKAAGAPMPHARGMAGPNTSTRVSTHVDEPRRCAKLKGGPVTAARSACAVTARGCRWARRRRDTKA